jgi:chloramphenicol 3-O phosphotransferase
VTTPIIIFLNGASSSGKTSIAKALQATMEEPYVYFSADIRKPMLPAFRDGLGWEVDAILGNLRHGYYACILALNECGNFVIADQAIEDRAWMIQCARTLVHTRAFLIGVQCPQAVAESRELERGDRILGLVASHINIVHQVGIYDIEVDTSILSSHECAERIKEYVKSNEPSALKRILATTP